MERMNETYPIALRFLFLKATGTAAASRNRIITDAPAISDPYRSAKDFVGVVLTGGGVVLELCPVTVTVRTAGELDGSSPVAWKFNLYVPLLTEEDTEIVAVPV